MAAKKKVNQPVAEYDDVAEEAEGEPEETEVLKPADEKYLAALVKESRELFATQDTQLEEWRKLVNSKKPPFIPEKYRHTQFDVKLPDLKDEINRNVNLTTSQDPALLVRPLAGTGDPDKAQGNATMRKHFFEAAFRYGFRVSQGIDGYRQLCKAVYGDGASVTKMVYRPDMWQERFTQIGRAHV